MMTSTINKLSESLGHASSVTEMTGLIEDFYEQYGVGIFGLHKAFRVKGDSEDSFTTYPILNIAVTSLSDLEDMRIIASFTVIRVPESPQAYVRYSMNTITGGFA